MMNTLSDTTSKDQDWPASVSTTRIISLRILMDNDWDTQSTETTPINRTSLWVVEYNNPEDPTHMTISAVRENMLAEFLEGAP